MKIGNLFIYTANNTPTKPLCVAGSEISLTIWLDENGEVTGVLAHTFENNNIKNVVGAGDIPAEYVAYEENAGIDV